MSPGWTLAIDFGTSFTTAALIDRRGAEVLEIDGVRRLPSMVVLAGDELVVGLAARSQQALYPSATEAHPKQLLGVRDSVLLGGRPVRLVDAVGAVLAAVAAEARRRRDGQAPDTVWLTHPARWNAQRLAALGEAATIAGLPPPHFLPEPVAAALHYASREIGERAHVAVFDLGGGTLDTAVLQRRGAGFELVGPPGGDVDIGGETFDSRLAARLIEYVANQRPDVVDDLRTSDAPEWRRAAVGLVSAARETKEALSRQTSHSVYLAPPIDLELRVTRPELESLIADDVERAVDEFEATIGRAHLGPDDLAGYYLTGGGGRIPLVAQRLEARLGRAPSTYDDPKLAVVLGVARLPSVAAASTAAATPVASPAAAPAAETARLAAPAIAPGAAPGAAPVTAPLPASSVPPSASSETGAAVVAPASSHAHGSTGTAFPDRTSGRWRWVALSIAALVTVVAVAVGVLVLNDDRTVSDDSADSAADDEGTAGEADAGGDEPPTATQMLELLNEVRVDEGLDPLVENGELSASARGHSTDLAEEGELFHTDELGESLSVPVDAVGELVGAGPVDDPRQIVDGFLEDGDSRSQLLDPAFELAGVGVVPQGSTVWVTVQLAQPSG